MQTLRTGNDEVEPFELWGVDKVGRHVGYETCKPTQQMLNGKCHSLMERQ